MTILISRTITAPNGVVVEHHCINRFESPDLETVNINVDSWPNEQARLDGAGPAWAWGLSVPSATISTADGLLAGISAAVLADENFAGGATIPDAADTIEHAKNRKRAEIKAWRSAREYGGFEWDGSAFDSDPESRSRIMGAVQLAEIAMTAGEAFERTWILSDNTTRVLSGDDMIQVGVALGTMVGAAFDSTIGTYAAIDAATTIEDVASVAPPA